MVRYPKFGITNLIPTGELFRIFENCIRNYVLSDEKIGIIFLQATTTIVVDFASCIMLGQVHPESKKTRGQRNDNRKPPISVYFYGNASIV